LPRTQDGTDGEIIHEEEIDQAVSPAALAISVEIDRMISSIPAADPEKLAEQLLELGIEF
jgi:hypothetical protein